jgi:alkylhydroperoxidase family enzyme
MARMDYVDADAANDRVQDLLGKLDHKNIFRMLAHSPSHFETYVRMGNAIRFKGELDPGLRELAITRAGILCKSDYEVIAHKRIGKSIGLEDAKIDALEEGAAADDYSDLEKDVLRFADEVVTSDRVSDELFERLQGKVTQGALVELHLAIGFYIMTSKFLVTFGVDLQS